jgi:cytidylate kinase
MSKLVIAIDGPAGAGKSTIAKMLSKKLGLSFLDTGAMYRCLALKSQRLGVSADDADALAHLAVGIDIRFGVGEPQPVYLDGEDVTQAIRTLELGDLASKVSQYSPVRKEMVRLQQEYVKAGGLVLEGRDATTVIAPEAQVKVYLTASLEERAKRRHKELVEKGVVDSYDEVRRQVLHRDHRDINRDDSPLTVAEGASVIESAKMTLDEVMHAIIDLIPSYLLPSQK